MSMRKAVLVTVATLALVGLAGAVQAQTARDRLVVERTVSELQDDLLSNRTTSEALVRAYLDRINRVDRAGPTLRSVIATNPEALAQARALDAERRAGKVRGPLHGIPVLIKDNIDMVELPTTAGSLALKDNRVNRDAPLVARLREAGAVILGKTNLSEWANYRSTRSISGWSAVGGLVRNPHALDRNACGSSSGSGAAAAASLAAATVGTETSGSILCPAAVNGVVGFKPTVGLVSRTHVVPISHTQDTAGPMTRTVMDAALLLTALAGTDPADPATAEADARRTDYAARLTPDALKGKRLGVMRLGVGGHEPTTALYEQALADLKAAGAELVEIPGLPAAYSGAGNNVGPILSTEFKVDLNAYLATAAPAVTTRTLADLIAFNTANADRQMPLFGQELFVQSEATKGLDDPDYRKALETSLRTSGPEGIDALLKEHRVDALITITAAPAWPTDPAGASRSVAVPGLTGIAASARYPHLTVPMGLAEGLPVGLSFVGTAWADADILAMGYAYEQVSRRRAVPAYRNSLADQQKVQRAYAPAR